VGRREPDRRLDGRSAPGIALDNKPNEPVSG